MSGAIGGFLSNPLEYLLLNTQNSNQTLRELIKELPSFRNLWQGAHYTMMYYGVSSMLLFITLEKVCEFLD